MVRNVADGGRNRPFYDHRHPLSQLYQQGKRPRRPDLMIQTGSWHFFGKAPQRRPARPAV